MARGKLPEPGHPLEIVLLLIWKMRQNIEFQKSRATLQALLNQKGAEPKNIESAFADLREAFFPFDKNQRKQEIDQMRNAMLREIQRGPVYFSPMRDPNEHKVTARLARGQEALVRRQAEMNRGKARRLDSGFEEKRRRRTAG